MTMMRDVSIARGIGVLPIFFRPELLLLLEVSRVGERRKIIYPLVPAKAGTQRKK
jgi:hypothetical protein